MKPIIEEGDIVNSTLTHLRKLKWKTRLHSLIKSCTILIFIDCDINSVVFIALV